MTNEMIIFWNAVDLMNAGVIGTTGRVLTFENDDGEVMEVQEPEEIHTFAKWKDMGFSVKKGEHAVARFSIWKGAEKTVKDEEGNETDEKVTKMFRKESCFFTAAQVEPMKEWTEKRRGSSRSRAVQAAPMAIPSSVAAAPASDAGYGSWLS